MKTYLYVKRHIVTGLLYFGKTVKNPYKCNGSGLRWKRHLRKHGALVETLSVWEFDNADDAEAYAKEAVIKADGALDKKLAAYVEVQKAFAEAFSKAPVPSVNMAGTGNTGRGGEAQDFLSLLTVKAAKDLQLDMSVKR